MGRIVLFAALISLGVMGAIGIGIWLGRRRTRLAGPRQRPAPVTAGSVRQGGIWIGAGILVALVLLGFLIKSPTGG